MTLNKTVRDLAGMFLKKASYNYSRQVCDEIDLDNTDENWELVSDLEKYNDFDPLDLSERPPLDESITISSSMLISNLVDMISETFSSLRTAEIEIIAAAENLMYEYGRSPEDRHKNIQAKNRLYTAVRELQHLRGDEDTGGPTPPKEDLEDLEVRMLRDHLQTANKSIQIASKLIDLSGLIRWRMQLLLNCSCTSMSLCAPCALCNEYDNAVEKWNEHTQKKEVSTKEIK